MSVLLVWATALAAVALLALAALPNRVIKRRLRFTLLPLVALAILHATAQRVPEVGGLAHEAAFEQLLLALALINACVTLLFNPWFQDRVPDRSPAIVQDTIVIGAFGAAAVFVLKDATFLTASAIAAAAVGFALQDTLANAFSGLAIQIEKPFRVGHWVSVASYEGVVAEVTWRATKLRTKAGNLVVIPNNIIAKEAINNYSEPAAPTRFFVEVGAAYGVPPNQVRDAMLAAMRQVPRLLATPAPDVLLQDFGGSAMTYRARFWIDDFRDVDRSQDEVRRAIYYEFRRRSIEIPWPIQVQYERREMPDDTPERRDAFRRTIAHLPVTANLDADTHRALAAAAVERLYGDGEVIVREGDAGRSMFLVQQGRVAITVGLDRREVAVTEAGGYFGEMSLLTGDPRTATVVARGDCTVLEIAADAFGTYLRGRPEVIDQLAAAASARRRDLDATRAAQGPSPVEPATLAQRIRKFFAIAH